MRRTVFFDYPKVNIDETKTQEVFHRWAMRLLFEATRAAMEAIATEFILNHKIASGEAYGSLMPLGRAVRALMFAGGPKSSLGASKATHHFETSYPIYSVYWETTVTHFALSELFSLKHHKSGEHISDTPWHFWDVAYEAFHKYLVEHWLEYFPDFTSFLDVTHVGVP
jgi:hypothetical protein